MPSVSLLRFLKTIYVNIYSNIIDITIAEIPSIVITTLVSLSTSSKIPKYPIWKYTDIKPFALNFITKYIYAIMNTIPIDVANINSFSWVRFVSFVSFLYS